MINFTRHNSAFEKLLTNAYINSLEDVVQEIVDTVNNLNISGVYTKDEMDTMINNLESVLKNADTTLEGKLDSVKTTIENKIDTLKQKVEDLQLGVGTTDLSNYYDKPQVDAKLLTKANTVDVYTKTQTDTTFLKKADGVSNTTFNTFKIDIGASTLKNDVATLKQDIVDVKADVQANTDKFADYTTTTDMNTKLGLKVDKTVYDTKISDIEADILANTNKFADYTTTTDLEADYTKKTDFDALETKVTQLQLDTTEIKDDILDGHSFKWLTQAEYDALTPAQQQDVTIEYHITDAVDLVTQAQITKKDKLKTTVPASGTLTLTADKNQIASITNNTTIELPTVTEFTEIRLFFNTTSALTLTFPTLKWQGGAPSIEANKKYEIIFTFVDEWIAKVIVYE